MKVILSSIFAAALITVLTVSSPVSAGMAFKGTAVSSADTSSLLVKVKKSCAEKNAKCMKKAKGKDKKLAKCAKKMNKCEAKKMKKMKKDK